MKKFLFGFLALTLIAVVTAFALPSKSQSTKVAFEEEYSHWYELDGSTVVREITQDKTRSQMISQNLHPCDNAGAVECAIGTDEPLELLTNVDPGDFTGDAVIYKTTP